MTDKVERLKTHCICASCNVPGLVEALIVSGGQGINITREDREEAIDIAWGIAITMEKKKKIEMTTSRGGGSLLSIELEDSWDKIK